jgi:aryl-alcohol dehydrogenase-like predicted oxidoreductase
MPLVRQRPLGTATVTAVGCGDVSLAIASARNVDASELGRALHHALALGISLVEVAPEEDAERLVGDAVRALRLRDGTVVATHIALVAERPGAPKRDPLLDRLPARYVQERAEASLRATKLDVLPLVILPVHSDWPTSSAWPELLGTLDRLVREGKVLQWGRLVDDPAPDTSGVTQFVVTAGTLNLCQRPDGIQLARHPLAGGALAGHLGPGVALARQDDRRAVDPATLERMAVTAAHLAPLVHHEPPAARSCDAARSMLERGRRPDHLESPTVADLALRWVIDRDAIALPRLHRREHVDAAIAAASAPPLSLELRQRLDSLDT